MEDRGTRDTTRWESRETVCLPFCGKWGAGRTPDGQERRSGRTTGTAEEENGKDGNRDRVRVILSPLRSENGIVRTIICTVYFQVMIADSN